MDTEKIELTNGSILEYKNGKWYRDGKYFSDYGLSKYKFYDPKKKSWMLLAKWGEIVPYTPNYDKLEELARQETFERYDFNSELAFRPSEKIITLRTKGAMNLADIPVNMLDSIARNTGRSRTNIKTNLGLVGKESTFGGHSKALGNKWSDGYIDPRKLVNNHAYFTGPEAEYLLAVDRNIANNGHSELSVIDAEKNVTYAYLHGLIKPQIKHYHNNVLADAFARYADNPSYYNPGLGNYVLMVTNIGNEVWGNPLIQNWWNTSGRYLYQKGLKE